MRQFSTLILAVLTLTVNARHISSDEAETIASSILNVQSSNQQSIKVKRITISSDNMETAPYYIFTGENAVGFAIIAGDDRVPCVLGYSDKGTIDPTNTPPQLQALLKSYTDQINSATTSKSHPSWMSPIHVHETVSTRVLLETAAWGQDAPYNQYTPKINGASTPTGCVATAMAIVMKYHNWPKGYNWSAMPTENVSTNNSSEIARLMKDAGEAVCSEYTNTETLGYTGLVSPALYSKFNYSHTAQMISSAHFEEDEYINIIKNELDNGRPLIWIGSGSGSHAFICDGYASDGTFHINWGWNGNYNGYFHFGALTPGDMNFSFSSGAVLMIKKPQDEPEYSKVAYIDYGYTVGINCMHGFGLNPELSDLEKDVPTLVSCSTFNVLGGNEWGIALANSQGKIKEILHSELCTGDNYSHYLPSLSIVIHSEIEDSDKLIAIAREPDGKWLPVRGTMETTASVPVHGHKPILSSFDYNIDPGLKFKAKGANVVFSKTKKKYPKGFFFDSIELTGPTNSVIELKINNLTAQNISEWDPTLNGQVTSPYVTEDKYTISGNSIPAEQMLELELNVDEAGELINLIPENNHRYIRALKLTGYLDDDDFSFIRSYLRNLKKSI